METLTITPELNVQLAQLKAKTELRDAHGKTVGIFLPIEQAEAELYEKAIAKVDRSLIERRKKENGNFPFAEVKKRLQELESTE